MVFSPFLYILDHYYFKSAVSPAATYIEKEFAEKKHAFFVHIVHIFEVFPGRVYPKYFSNTARCIQNQSRGDPVMRGLKKSVEISRLK